MVMAGVFCAVTFLPRAPARLLRVRVAPVPYSSARNA
jgi:hypothetical protein